MVVAVSVSKALVPELSAKRAVTVLTGQWEENALSSKKVEKCRFNSTSSVVFTVYVTCSGIHFLHIWKTNQVDKYYVRKEMYLLTKCKNDFCSNSILSTNKQDPVNNNQTQIREFTDASLVSRSETDVSVVQPSDSGSLAQCCVLVLHAHRGLGRLCARPDGSYMHHQLEAKWCVRLA